MAWQDILKVSSLQQRWNKLSSSQKKEVTNHMQHGFTAEKAIKLIEDKYGLRQTSRRKPHDSDWRERSY